MTTQTITPNTTTSNENLLHRAVRANSLFCGLSGTVIAATAPILSDVMGIAGADVFFGVNGTPFLQILGVTLLIYAAVLWWAAARGPVNRPTALAVIELDIAWVVLSAWVIFGNIWPLNTTGNIIVGLLADIVLVFAIVQAWGLRKQTRS